MFPSFLFQDFNWLKFQSTNPFQHIGSVFPRTEASIADIHQIPNVFDKNYNGSSKGGQREGHHPRGAVTPPPAQSRSRCGRAVTPPPAQPRRAGVVTPPPTRSRSRCARVSTRDASTRHQKPTAPCKAPAPPIGGCSSPSVEARSEAGCQYFKEWLKYFNPNGQLLVF